MPVTREAKYLSGADIGKHVRLMVPGGKYTGPWELAGELIKITHWTDAMLSLHVLREDGPKRGTEIPAETLATITGKAS